MVAERKKCFVWNRLIRRELIVNHHLYFTPGIVYEDILWNYQLYRHVSAILILPTITHFYEYNQNSITKLSPQRAELHVRSYTKVCIGMLKTDYERSLFVEQHLFIFWALLSAIDYNNQYASAIQARTKALLCKAKRLTKQSGLSPDMKSRQQDLVFCLFYSHVSAIAYGHLNGLSEVVQAIGFLKAAIPDLTFSHGTRQKLWTVMLHKMPTPVLGALLYSKQMLLKRVHRAAQGPNGA